MSKKEIRDALKTRPNTAIPEEFIQEKIIICCGEDPDQLAAALNLHLPYPTPHRHHYRNYHAWRYRGFTVILAGIGTGCLTYLQLGQNPYCR